MPAPAKVNSAFSAFFGGLRSALLSVYVLVLAGTYIGMGALAHGVGMSPIWMALSTVLVWAAPAQLILITGIGTGGTLIEQAIAISLSATRLFPMVVALLPLLRSPTTRLRDLLLPTHFTAISMWIESLRLLPSIPREHRIAFCNGLSAGYMGTAVISGSAGYYLAAGLPPLLAGVLLFLTPLSFFLSIVNNARAMIDRLALAIGLVLGPLLVYWHVQLDLMWTGLIGGSIAYAVHRFREAWQ
ncbi:MAG TPA: AzlC family ABC transporter permease [Pseudolabrys sp.]|nr:AzlC family ABC transporter permease [Pseudolabrys sp.]